MNNDKVLLTEFLQKKKQFPKMAAESFAAFFDTNHVAKGTQLLEEGSRSKKVFYLEKGLARLYYIKDGKDITHQFFTEGMLYVPIENVFLNQYYPYRFELLEPSIICSVDYVKLEAFLDTDVQLQRFVRNIMIEFIKMLSDRLYSIQFQPAQERYKVLLETRADILLRAPLGHIASYLGITQQTLSVIRAQHI